MHVCVYGGWVCVADWEQRGQSVVTRHVAIINIPLYSVWNIVSMATVWNFEVVSDKFNAIGIFIDGS
jgi:hypothetical protein